MASLFRQPKSPYWWIKYKDKFGKWNRRSTKLRYDSNQQTIEAEKLRAKRTLEEAEMAGKHIDHSGLFSNWATDWIRKCDVAEGTIHTRVCVWKSLEEIMNSLGVHHPCEITYKTASDIHQALISRGYSDLTVNARMVLLRMVMDEAVKMGFTDSNPTRMLRVKKGSPRRRKKELSLEDQRRIEEFIQSGKAEEWFEIIFSFGLYHGMRISECRLQPESFNLVNGTVQFTAKGGVDRTVPIHSKCLHIAEKICAGPPIDYPSLSAMGKSFIRMMRSLGIPITHHCLRVTCITRLHRSGISHVRIMKYVGHKTISSHLLYERLDVSDLVSVGEQLV